MFKYSDYIEDLVVIEKEKSALGFRIRLNGFAFVRLIKTAYFLAKKSNFKDFDDPEEIPIKLMRERTQRLTEKNRFPSEELIKLKSAQATNYLEILAHIGEWKIEERDPLSRGHYLEDPSKGAVKGNVFRKTQ